MGKSRMLFLLVTLAIAGSAAAAAFHPIEVRTSYAIGRSEQLSYGPSALRLAPDGTFWIVNPADNTLTNVDLKSGKERQIRLGQNAVAVTDLRFTDRGDLEALDGAADPPAVITLSSDGTVRDRKQLSVAATGTRGATETTADATTRPAISSSLSLAWGGLVTHHWRIRAGTDGDPDAAVESDTGAIAVKANRGVIRGVRVLAEQARGVFLLVEEVADGDPITVDATVRLYDRSGQLLGVARVPLAEQYTYVETPVAVSDEGDVYLLETKPDAAVIRQLDLTASIPEILQDPRERASRVRALSTEHTSATATLISRAQMEANARAYLTNVAWYPQTALTGTCRYRVAPRYLGAIPRLLGSVTYDWGGFDTVGNYNALINSGYTAGNINDSVVLGCARGVDCSGYVSRVWGQSTKYDTCSLSTISTVISVQSLLKGDILTKCNDHVVLFESFAMSGINDYESTTYQSLDRVVYINSSWSRLNGYTARRYNNVAIDPTTPVHASSTFSPQSGGAGVPVTFQSTWKNQDTTAMTARLTLRMPWGSTIDYPMSFVSGQSATGALFQAVITLQSLGRYDFAVTVTSTVTGRSARYPASGFATGPSVVNPTYTITPSTWVCGQSPVTIRAGAYMYSISTATFLVSKGNSYCGPNGSFVASGWVDIRRDGPSGAVVASVWYAAGSPQVSINVPLDFTWGSRLYYATIRNQGYWAGPITVTAR